MEAQQTLQTSAPLCRFSFYMSMEEEKNENSSMEVVHHYYRTSELSFLYTVSSVVVLAFNHVCPDYSISVVLIGRKKRLLRVGKLCYRYCVIFNRKVL